MLCEVVAALVDLVDGPFDQGDVAIGGVGGAGAVFGMPEVEVGAVLGEDGRQGLAVLVESGLGVGVLMPECGGAVVEGDNFDSGEVETFRHGMTLW